MQPPAQQIRAYKRSEDRTESAKLKGHFQAFTAGNIDELDSQETQKF